MGTGIARLDLTMNAALGVAVMQCKKRSWVLFCCVVLLVLCSQRGSSRVCLHDVSLMYTCVESAHGLEGGVAEEYVWRGQNEMKFQVYPAVLSFVKLRKDETCM
jgi:hypothetical protein